MKKEREGARALERAGERARERKEGREIIANGNFYNKSNVHDQSLASHPCRTWLALTLRCPSVFSIVWCHAFVRMQTDVSAYALMVENFMKKQQVRTQQNTPTSSRPPSAMSTPMASGRYLNDQ